MEQSFSNMYKVDCLRDEGDSIVYLFASVHRTESEFKKAVKAAAKEWIETDPVGFCDAERDYGTASVSEEPGSPYFAEEAGEANFTWGMAEEMPDEIAGRHGFKCIQLCSIDTTEYADVLD